MYMLNMVIILIVMYCNVVTAIDKIPTYLLRFNKRSQDWLSNITNEQDDVKELIMQQVLGGEGQDF